MNEKIKARHFTVPLTWEEFIQLRVDVALKCTKVQDWVAEAIREKLEKIKEEEQ